jgi:asparagine synthase (glutamine-hydrolysing)
MEGFDPRARFRPASEVVGRQVGDECVLVQLHTNRMYELNATGARIWELLAAGQDLGGIEARLQGEFDIGGQALRSELLGLVGRLRAEGLLMAEATGGEAGAARPAVVSDLSVAAGTERFEAEGAGAGRKAWVLEWESGVGRPPVIHDLAGCSVDIHWSPAGDLVLVEGAVLEVGGERRADMRQAPTDRVIRADRVGELHAELGEAWVHRLRGGYVIALWERRRDRLLVVRDAAGEVPCFYVREGRRLLVSTSLDALLEQAGGASRFYRVGLAEFLLDLTVDQQREETFYEHVRRLPSAHVLGFEGQAPRISRYWDPVPPGFAWATAEEAEALDERLAQAVRRCLVLGADSILLSGGFDSVTVAALADGKRADGQALHALSLHFREPACDEGAVQRAVAARLGLPLYLHAAERSDESEDFVDRALGHSGALPSPVLGLWQAAFAPLLEEARRQGLGHVLTGIGGDEMFTVDFDHGRDLLAAGDWRALARFVAAWQRTSPLAPLAVARTMIWNAGLRPLGVRLATRLLGRVSPGLLEGLRRGRRGRSLLRCGVDGLLEERRQATTEPPLAPGEGHYVATIRDLPQSPFLLLEMEQGAAWMEGFGLVGLYPYYDRDLMELALRLPPSVLFAGGRMKAPLRRLVDRRLPGFEMPPKKVDFTAAGKAILRRAGRRTWQRLGGAVALADLGLIEPGRTAAFVEAFFSGYSEDWLLVWRLLSTEAWVRARSGAALD